MLYGVGSIVGSFLWGKIYDRFRGRLHVLLVSHALLVGVNFILLTRVIAAPIAYPAAVFPVLLIVGTIFGLIDFLTNAIINNTISNKFEEAEVPLLFSWYRFSFCVGFAVASALSTGLTGVDQPRESGWLVMVWLCIVAMVLSVGYGWRLDRLLFERRASQHHLVVVDEEVL
jgi:MFS family permease